MAKSCSVDAGQNIPIMMRRDWIFIFEKGQKAVEILQLISIFILSVLLLITILNAVFGPYLRHAKSSLNFPKVCVLIPARNEEENIGRCLDSLLNQDYPNYNITVLDDDSSDATFSIVSDYSKRYETISCLKGKPLPEKWLGKNWACWQLSQQASGEILLFIDADTWHNERAISATIFWMEKFKLNMLSAFPQQITNSLIEKIIVPMIDIILYTLLPLWFTYLFKSPEMSAANGQWLAIRNKDYQEIGGHLRLKTRVVEDVEMARLCKRSGLKIMTLSGSKMVFCRMYKDFMGIWNGLSKNFFGLTGNNVIILLVMIAIMSLAFILPYIDIIFFKDSFMMWTVLSLVILIRLILALAYGHGIVLSLLFLPLTILIGMIIAVNSFYQSKFGSVSWKGRKVSLN
jgi:chlorobactene glucosyltransferase